MNYTMRLTVTLVFGILKILLVNVDKNLQPVS